MSHVYFEKSHQRAFGTYPLEGEVLDGALAVALDAGYRAIDTAQMYGNEADVGAALERSGVPRAELFVTTKVHPDNYDEAKFLPSVERSLADLRLDRVDVLLLHWPPIGGDIAASLRLLAQARVRGLATHIGVSNYTAAMMRRCSEIIADPIVTNQVEFHPLLNQDRLLEVAAETGIPLSSYSSVARGEVFKHALFTELGSLYGKTAGQIVLRWILQKGVSVNTMSTRPENIRANFDVMDFTLSCVDMARIEKMTQNDYRIVTADLVPWAPVWD